MVYPSHTLKVKQRFCFIIININGLELCDMIKKKQISQRQFLTLKTRYFRYIGINYTRI